jgi:Calx-beta domain/FG-GAP-like repeat/FG-GAP repeat
MLPKTQLPRECQIKRTSVLLLVLAGMLTALGAFASAQNCSIPSFTQSIYAVGGDVRSVAVADFDGDGRPDLAVANADLASVSVLTNVIGLGGPAVNNSYSVGTFPLSVAAGDFTGDGKPDIITANDSSNTISLLRNNGAGGFVPAGTFNTGAGPVGLAVGDFNNNGNLDVAVATSSNVNVLLGNGQGGFGAPINLPGGASKIITADFNNDGRLDLAVEGNSIQIYLGDGTGHFSAASCSISAGGGLAAGDVNGDGKLDLVVANVPAAQIQVSLGDGAGCFGAPTGIDVLNAGRPGFVALGDLNKDGKLDIVAGATVLLGNGTGGFGAPVAYGMGSLGSGPGANTVIADFDGDSNLDIASAATGTAGILFGDGAGGFRFAVGPSDRGAYGLARADLNGDGKLDLVVMSNGNFVVMLGDGTGKLSAPTIVNVPSSSSFVGPVIADFNGDTKLDVAVVDATANGPGGAPRFHVLPGDGLGGFGSAISTSFDAAEPFSVAGGDLNGDGRTDLVTVNRGGGNNNEGSISIGLGDGAGHFTMQPKVSVRTPANPAGVGFGDFNSDGKMDLAIPSGFGFGILLGNGAGGFAPRIEITTANASSIRTADLNGDGKADLAMVSEEPNGKLSVVFGDGQGGFSAPNQFSLGFFPEDLTVADFNSDGKLDLAVAISRQEASPSPTRSAISVLFGDGMGGFGPASTILADRGAWRIVAGDLNGDARPDIITANQPVNNLTVALNTCTGPILTGFLQFSAPTYSVGEGDGSVNITVTRTGNTVGPASVKYATSDGSASSRSDYMASFGTLRFNDGETSKSFSVLIVDDARATEGNESFNVTLSEPVGATLGAPSAAVVGIVDNDPTVTAVNPIDSTDFFVHQHYLDFLNRLPDAAGLQFWTSQITECDSRPEPERTSCREVLRINVSAAFFLSIEFQETGYLVYRIYKTAYGDATSLNVPGTVPIVRLNEFLGDSQQIGQGVIVGQGNWQQLLENNKNAFVLEYVQRQRFTDAFPLSMTPLQFVDKLNQNAGLVLSQNEHDQLVTQLTGATDVTAGRAAALRQVAEHSLLRQREFNRAFVLMQYFGYLRRNPDDPQDSDFRGWKFWLDKLNQFNGNFIDAEMVKAFLSSTEYRVRFNSANGF